MPQFRKKPVVIEAVQWTGDEAQHLPEWLPAVAKELGEFEEAAYVPPGSIWRKGNELWIGTLEGGMKASPGDWIIKGVKGEIYPCKPDIFAATYDPA